MELGEMIARYRKDAGMTIDELSEASGVPKGTLNKIIAGTTKAPTLDTMKAIAKALGKRLADFDGGIHAKTIAPAFSAEAMEVAKTFDQLDGHGRGAVKEILDFEHASAVAEKRQSGTPKRPELKVRKRSDGFVDYRVYDQPAAAGLGNYLDDPAYHIEQYPANVVPDGADFGIRISGTSMSPDIPDGCTVFVQSRSSIEPGSIGIFLLNGEAYCKKLTVDREKGQIRLVSINKAYQDRIIEECDDFSTMGLVLGHWET